LILPRAWTTISRVTLIILPAPLPRHAAFLRSLAGRIILSVLLIAAAAASSTHAAHSTATSIPPRPTMKRIAWDDAQKVKIEKLATVTALALEERDYYRLRQVFDIERFVTELEAGLGLPPEDKEALRADFRKYVIDVRGGILGSRTLDPRADVKFVLLVEVDGRIMARLRVVEGGWMSLNYWDLEPGLAEDGSIKWFDMNDAWAGDSEVLRRRAYAYVYAAKRDLLGRAARERLTSADHARWEYGQWEIASRKNPVSIDEALAKLDVLSARGVPWLRRYRLWHLSLRPAQRDAFKEAAEGILQDLPPGPGRNFIDYWRCFVGKDNEATLKAIDALTASYGPDPFHDALRALMHTGLKQFDKAKAAAKKAVEALPRCKLAHDMLAGSSLHTGDFETAAAELRLLANKFNSVMTTTELKEKFPRFCESEPGKEYLEWTRD
jgi:hypothetical protein